MQSESLGSWFGGDGDPQAPCDAAVVIPTVLRPALLTSLESVFRQDLDGRIQVLIGVDAPSPAPPALLELIARRPANVSVLLLTLPYSTSIRHGGVHRATDGGSLRSILTFMAASRHVAYLDDDNAWERDHLSSLRAAIAGKAWAYSLRMLVDEASGEELGIDRELVSLTKRAPIVHDFTALALCYMHIAKSENARGDAAGQLRALRRRFMAHRDYFSKQGELKNGLAMLSEVMDKTADRLSRP